MHNWLFMAHNLFHIAAECDRPYTRLQHDRHRKTQKATPWRKGVLLVRLLSVRPRILGGLQLGVFLRRGGLKSFQAQYDYGTEGTILTHKR